MIEKSVPRDHRLSSLGKPRDAKRRSLGGFFYPTLTLLIDSYITPKLFAYLDLCAGIDLCFQMPSITQKDNPTEQIQVSQICFLVSLHNPFHTTALFQEFEQQHILGQKKKHCYVWFIFNCTCYIF